MRARRIGRNLLLLLLSFSLTSIAPASSVITVASITDGDTIKLGDGRSVRLLQIDTPELRGSECYAKEAQVALANLLNQRGALRLKTDPNLDRVDAYGRLLRYVFKGRMNLNLEMVKIGAATPYFYKRELGRYSDELLKAAQSAQERKIGLWGACPGTRLNPYYALTTVSGTKQSPKPTQSDSTSSSQSQCDPNYAGCVPLFPPDLNCSDIKRLGLAPVKVIGRDVHRLDADGDGLGCTS